MLCPTCHHGAPLHPGAILSPAYVKGIRGKLLKLLRTPRCPTCGRVIGRCPDCGAHHAACWCPAPFIKRTPHETT